MANMPILLPPLFPQQPCEMGWAEEDERSKAFSVSHHKIKSIRSGSLAIVGKDYIQ